MSRRVVIDSLVFAREGRSLQGELPVSSLARILDMLADQEGELNYRVQGQMSPRRRVRSVLELISDEEDLTQEEIEDDSKDFLPAEKALDVVALIEDEIILNLPTAPRHEACVLPEAGVQAEKVSPFAVLQSLKNRVH